MRPVMEREEMEVFLLLAEELHFGRTADRVRLSRARVSQIVQRLERRVGAALFVRTSRRVALTALGRQLRDDLEPHYRGIRDAFARAVETARGVESVLVVGFSTALAGEIALKTTEALRATHPGLMVELCQVPLSDPYGQLRGGDVDLQLSEFPAEGEELDGGPTLFTEGRVLAVASGHPLAGRDSVSLEDLAGLPLVGVAGELPASWRAAHVPARTPSGRPVGQGPVVTHLQEALMLVAAGKGALLSAAHTATYHSRPGITYVPFRDASPVGYGLMWRTGDDTAPVRLFAEAARGITRGMGPGEAEARATGPGRPEVRTPAPVRGVRSP
ncbi:LysR family transcriptional regulator [Streptomyces sp. NPDC051018]|uniref:LysR family transcriptional regulator n=1 Tax=Streptomyces sp. NPDC051018 TaxID=3365639 RepID=UPI00379E4B34